MHGRWIPFDIVAIGKPDGRTSELVVGSGRRMIVGKHINWTTEVLLVKDLGEKTRKSYYIQPFQSLSGALGTKLKYQAVLIPYFPISRSGKFQVVIERARFTTNTKIGTIGAGIGGIKSGRDQFQARPLISFQPKKWPVDFWYQLYLPTTKTPYVRHTFQVRFSFKRTI